MQKQGKNLSKSNYTKQITANNKTYNSLKSANTYLVRLRRGVSKNSEKWKEYQDQIDSNTSSMYSLMESNEDLKDSLRDDIYWKPFDKMQQSIDNTKDGISSLIGLIDDDSLFDDNGNLTDFGVAKNGLLVQGLNTAKDDIKSYESQIANANKLWNYYLKGASNGYSEEEYLADMDEFTKGLQGALSDAKSYTDQIVDFYKNQQQAIIDTLNEEIEARSEALKKKKEYYDYDKSIRSKTKDIQAIETQIAAISAMEDSLEKRKKLLELQEQLQTTKDDLEDTQTDHEINLVVDGLNDFTADIQDTFDKSIEELKTNLQKQAEIIASANDMYVNSFSAIQKKLAEVLKFYGASTSGVTASSADYENLQAENASKTQLAKEKYDANKSKINTNAEKKTANAKKNYDSNLANANTNYTNKKANARSDYDAEIASYNAQWKQAEADYDKQIAVLKKKEKSGKISYSLYRKLVDNTKNLLHQQNKEIHSKKEQAYNEYLSEVAQLKKKLSRQKEKLKKQYQAQLDRIAAEKKSDLAGNNSNYKAQLVGIEKWYKEQIANLDIAGFAKGGVVGDSIKGVISKNGDSLIASVNPRESIMTQDFTKMLPESVDIMRDFIKISTPNFSSLATPKIQMAQPNVNVEFTVQGDVGRDVWKDIQSKLPKISQYVSNDIYTDLKKTGALRK